jgi:hypothetical protein
MRAAPHLVALLLLAASTRLEAVPPLVSGDVPTADKGRFEWYVGTLFENNNGSVGRELPLMELVYGLTERQEITFEIPWLSEHGVHGWEDAVVGTKYMLVKETQTLPGISGSLEVKLPSASTARGLGTGEFDYGLLLRAQKTWGWFTLLGNVGYTLVGGPDADDVWFLSVAQFYELTKRTLLLSEVYFETSEAPEASSRLVANIGFEHQLADNFNIHASIGTSLREHQQGGPDLRAYIGFKWEFDAPWKSRPL